MGYNCVKDQAPHSEKLHENSLLMTNSIDLLKQLVYISALEQKMGLSKSLYLLLLELKYSYNQMKNHRRILLDTIRKDEAGTLQILIEESVKLTRTRDVLRSHISEFSTQLLPTKRKATVFDDIVREHSRLIMQQDKIPAFESFFSSLQLAEDEVLLLCSVKAVTLYQNETILSDLYTKVNILNSSFP